MRQGQNSKRSRGRSGGRRNASPRHQSFDSNGPSIRIRGNAHQVYEKYIQLARDANAAGDRVTAENMYQHAEHYFRIMNVDDGDSQQRGQNRGNGSDQRPNQRNAPQDQEEPPAGIEANFLVKAPNAADEGANGSGENRTSDAAEPAKERGEASADSDEPRRERPPRRTRRNGARQRSDAPAAETPAVEAAEAEVIAPEAPAVAEAEPAPEAAEADAKEA